MKKIILLILTLLITTFIVTACQNYELETIKVCEVTHSVFYAPQYVAINKGFFENEGLKVNLTNGGGADKVMTAVISGKADIGFSGPEACIYVYNEGLDDYPKLFCQLTKRDGSFLLAHEPITDFKWEDLKGKTIIGGRKGGVPEMTLEYVLKNNGIIPCEDVTIDTTIQFSLMAGAFTSNQGDFVTLFEPVATRLVQEGKGYIVASIGKESGEIPYTAYYATQRFIEDNRDIIASFTKAISEGQKWVSEHSPEEIAEAIKPSFPDTDISILIEVARRYNEQDTWCKTPAMKEKSFNRLQEVMSMAGELSKTVEFSEIVYSTIDD